ncbi:2-dehydro-3-deoxy-6-phosphogalactonate aldolase [Polaromonas sp.]|uniref:2-dehydro-3-deoxy-6-phosphogalactonate aldolase n=1 Tax=Polaromonas sp. TaxID=1869339 RepID=UPI002D76B424|nr:2-dehydro-3-deoxy-6-phosphogalactonate aldolase [Polaromonas sp.]
MNAQPAVAILRGVQTHEVLEVAQVLLAEGIDIIEIPLNSPKALASIRLLADQICNSCVLGAGTVLGVSDVDAAAEAGAQLILSPNMDVAVIKQTRARGLFSMPGVATASEAFAALQAGAHALKVFPADVLGPASIRAWNAVLPAGTALYAVGGVDTHNMQQFRLAGVRGVGLGSALYVPGMSLPELGRRARALLDAWKNERPL